MLLPLPIGCSKGLDLEDFGAKLLRIRKIQRTLHRDKEGFSGEDKL